MGSEYALIYMNMSNWARILNMPVANMSKYVCECGWICLKHNMGK